MKKNVLVTGATGKQGGAVVDNLISLSSANDFVVYAVTRNPQSTSALKLAEKPTVKVIKGDLDDPEALFSSAAAPIWGVFSVQVPMGGGATPQTEEKQGNILQAATLACSIVVCSLQTFTGLLLAGKALIDAALAHGSVEHFVYASVDRGGDRSSLNATTVPHFISKHHVEEYLREKTQGTKMHYTILRPVAFMENLTNDFAGKGFSTAWKVTLGAKPLQLVATHDIGYFAAQAFLNPNSSQYSNTALSIAGDSLSFAQANEVFKGQTGKLMPLTFETLARTALWAVKDLGLMFSWFNKEGYGADTPSLKQMHPGLMNFETWLQQKSAWKK